MSIIQPFKTDCECLTNELFLEIFNYLNASQIYRAFFSLNTRFDVLIVEYYRTCRINFQSISKSDFDMILYDHLEPMAHQITSICLSDGDDTPGQIDQFFSSGFSLSRFFHLRSLCLDNIRSQMMMNRIIVDLPSLQLLTHLTLKQCYYPSATDNNVDEQTIFGNTIWTLPKLEYCCFKVDYKYRQSHHYVNRYRRDQSILLTGTAISSTLKYLSLTGFDRCDASIDDLLQRSPSLKSLAISHWVLPHTDTLNAVQSLTQLSISFGTNFNYRVNSFLERFPAFPNLVHLKIDFNHVHVYFMGDQWERIISQRLLRLEKFEFKMPVYNNGSDSMEQSVNSRLRSFQSPFWLEKHRWYVQCDWIPEREEGVLYTLPYTFEYFQTIYPIRSKSTHPNADHRFSYDHVRHLMYKPRYPNMPSGSQIQLRNIQHLSIQLPLTEHFWSLVPSLSQLISLDVLSEDHDDFCQKQLQNLLDRAPRLSSIRLSWKNLTSSLMQLFNSHHLSVYQLELFWFNGHFNQEQCLALDTLLPGIHCSVLNLNVSGNTCILALVNTMHHLRALNVEYPKKRKLKIQGEKICQSLKEQLSPIIPNLILSQQDDRIRLWLR